MMERTITILEGKRQEMPSGNIVVHKGTAVYLRSIGAVARSQTAHEVPASEVDVTGKYIGQVPKTPYYESP